MKDHFNRRLFRICLLIFLIQNFSFAQYKHEEVQDYINKHKDLAIEQMIRFRIPASVILAQAIKESGCGSSFLALHTNNHFGIKCHVEWGGEKSYQDDDSLSECFRTYRSVDESYLDHSMFLVSRPRYSFLFEIPISDYFQWCIGLKKAGYATADNYADELLYYIEVYNLHQYDGVETMLSVKADHLLISDFEPSNIFLTQNPDLDSIEIPNLVSAVFGIPAKKDPPLLARSDNRIRTED